jgi:hypothetical protein
MERLRRMTMQERIIAALSMPADFAWINPTPASANHHVRPGEQH